MDKVLVGGGEQIVKGGMKWGGGGIVTPLLMKGALNLKERFPRQGLSLIKDYIALLKEIFIERAIQSTTHLNSCLGNRNKMLEICRFKTKRFVCIICVCHVIIIAFMYFYFKMWKTIKRKKAHFIVKNSNTKHWKDLTVFLSNEISAQYAAE